MSSNKRSPALSSGQEREKGYRRKRRREGHSADREKRFGQSSRSHTQPQWIVFALVVCLLCIVDSLPGLLFRGKATTDAPATDATWHGPRPIEVAHAFTAATTTAERLQWVYHPEEVAALMEEFYTHGPGSTETITELAAMRTPLKEGRAFQSFIVTMADGAFRKLDVSYELDGHARVDFKSYCRYCSKPWSALLDGSCATAAEMRVRLRVDSYYNRDFEDESTWLCLIATSLDLKDPVYLYARRDNPEMRDLLRDLPNREARYTVSIQNTAAGWEHRQFILSKVLRSGWLSR